jgi:glycosyltransferase involved in cell wall biosynthesis
MTAPRRLPISVVVLTYNEEQNLRACLESLAGWVSDLFIVDSGSTDRTLAIAEELGAKVVTHRFETHTRQWRWALANLPLQTEWILALDADQRVSPELRDAILAAFSAGGSATAADGYFLIRRQVFRGRWIKYGGYYPKYLLKLFRRGAVALDEGDLVDHHFHVTGRLVRLPGDLIEDNRNEARIFDWIEKHNRYARLQATQEIRRLGLGPRPKLWGSPDERTAWMKSVWSRLPLYLRPIGYFIYRYFLRLGFLDGKEGFVFHVMQAFWYRLLVDINRDEQSCQARPMTVSPPAPVVDSNAQALAGREPVRLRDS